MAPGISFLCGLIRAIAVFAELGLQIAEEIARIVSRLNLSARGIFPFRLAQQSVGFARLGGQPFGIGLRIVPVQATGRMRPRLREPRIAPRMTFLQSPFPAVPNAGGPYRVMTGVRYERPKLIDRHRILADREGSRDPHVALRPFVGEAAFLFFRRTHRESPGGDDDHDGKIDAFPELVFRRERAFLVRRQNGGRPRS